MVSYFELLMGLVRNVSEDELEVEQGTSMMMLGCTILVIIVSAFVATFRKIEEAMAEMKKEMKAQGEEMSRVREENDAALESKKEEMDSHFELLMELVRNVSQARETCNGALNELGVDANEKDAESLSKLKQIELSLQGALQKISIREKKTERSNIFEEMTEKLVEELQAKEAGIQSAREIEEAMAEMKEEMKAALESKLCILTEVKGLKKKLEMQAKMLVKAQVDKEKEQKDNDKAIQKVTEKEAAIKSAKQEIAEANSKLVKTEFNLEKEVKDNKDNSSLWKSTGTKLVSHSSNNDLSC